MRANHERGHKVMISDRGIGAGFHQGVLERFPTVYQLRLFFPDLPLVVEDERPRGPAHNPVVFVASFQASDFIPQKEIKVVLHHFRRRVL